VGPLAGPINPIYLVTSNIAGVTYGANPNNKRISIPLEGPLNALAGAPGVAAGLQVVKAFDPADAGLHRSARAILLTHSTLSPDKLGALAFQAGFGFVRRQGVQIYCSVAPGENIDIVQAGTLLPLGGDLTVGTPVDLQVRFDVIPLSGTYNWTFNAPAGAAASVDFVLRPKIRLTPQKPGTAALTLLYTEADPNRTLPYTLEIRLKPALDVPGVFIPKHEYDLIMNILNFFHPIGVETATGSIRQHVVEVEQDPQRAFPAYTYPDFRV
jgi:hypothetical protein